MDSYIFRENAVCSIDSIKKVSGGTSGIDQICIHLPLNLLDEVVNGDSAKEGDVVFEVPASAKDVVLQISSGDEKSRVPLKLP